MGIGKNNKEKLEQLKKDVDFVLTQLWEDGEEVKLENSRWAIDAEICESNIDLMIESKQGIL